MFTPEYCLTAKPSDSIIAETSVSRDCKCKIIHKNKEYDGLHEPIISEELFNNVQNLLKANSVQRKHSTNAKTGSLLAGLLFDDKGNKMSPSYSNANNKHYRYYISMSIKNPVDYERGEITKISAGEIENFVQNDLRKV